MAALKVTALLVATILVVTLYSLALRWRYYEGRLTVRFEASLNFLVCLLVGAGVFLYAGLDYKYLLIGAGFGVIWALIPVVFWKKTPERYLPASALKDPGAVAAKKRETGKIISESRTERVKVLHRHGTFKWRWVHQLESAIDLDPENMEAYRTLALIYLERKELGQARSTVKKGLRVSSSDKRLRELNGLLEDFDRRDDG